MQSLKHFLSGSLQKNKIAGHSLVVFEHSQSVQKPVLKKFGASDPKL